MSYKWSDTIRAIVIDVLNTNVAHTATTPLSDFAAPTTLIDMNGQRVTNAHAAVDASDLTTKGDVAALIAALGDLAIEADLLKTPAKASAIADVTLATPGATIDGVTLSNGDRVLLTGQGTGSQNGLWVFNGAAAAMTRPTDYAHLSTVLAKYGMAVQVLGGTLRAGYVYILTTTAAITIDTTSQAWTALPPNLLAIASDVKIANAGKGLYVKEGTNGKLGSVVLVTGTKDIANTAITANSKVFTQVMALGTVTDPMPMLVTVNAGVGFTITSEDATDTSTVAYFVVEPA